MNYFKIAKFLFVDAPERITNEIEHRLFPKPYRCNRCGIKQGLPRGRYPVCRCCKSPELVLRLSYVPR